MVAISSEKLTKKPKAPPCAENEGYYPDDLSPVDVTGWLTANQAIDLLGCSRVTLDRYARQGHIRPAKARRDPGSVREVFVYCPAELARLPRKYRGTIPSEAGELAARVFELFEKGHPDRAIVLELRQTPQKINELRMEWLDGGGSHIVVAGEAKAAIAEMLGEDFGSVAELIAKLRVRLGGGANENA